MSHAPKIVLDERAKQGAPLIADPDRAWAAAGWFGLLLAFVGLADFALALYPPGFGTVEWEFGTVAAMFAGLPLVTMGFAGMLASALARGRRRTIIVIASALLLLAAVTLALWVVFLSDVPVALRVVQGEALVGIKKAAVKTSILGLAFSFAYLVVGLGAIRYVRRGRS